MVAWIKKKIFSACGVSKTNEPGPESQRRPASMVNTSWENNRSPFMNANDPKMAPFLWTRVMISVNYLPCLYRIASASHKAILEQHSSSGCPSAAGTPAPPATSTSPAGHSVKLHRSSEPPPKTLTLEYFRLNTPQAPLIYLHTGDIQHFNLPTNNFHIFSYEISHLCSVHLDVQLFSVLY